MPAAVAWQGVARCDAPDALNETATTESVCPSSAAVAMLPPVASAASCPTCSSVCITSSAVTAVPASRCCTEAQQMWLLRPVAASVSASAPARGMLYRLDHLWRLGLVAWGSKPQPTQHHHGPQTLAASHRRPLHRLCVPVMPLPVEHPHHLHCFQHPACLCGCKHMRPTANAVSNHCERERVRTFAPTRPRHAAPHIRHPDHLTPLPQSHQHHPGR